MPSRLAARVQEIKLTAEASNEEQINNTFLCRTKTRLSYNIYLYKCSNISSQCMANEDKIMLYGFNWSVRSKCYRDHLAILVLVCHTSWRWTHSASTRLTCSFVRSKAELQRLHCWCIITWECVGTCETAKEKNQPNCIVGNIRRCTYDEVT